MATVAQVAISTVLKCFARIAHRITLPRNELYPWSIMTRTPVRILLALLACAVAVSASYAKESETDSKHDSGDEPDSPRILKDENQVTSGFITVKGARMSYQAEAGVQVVYLKD